MKTITINIYGWKDFTQWLVCDAEPEDDSSGTVAEEAQRKSDAERWLIKERNGYDTGDIYRG